MVLVLQLDISSSLKKHRGKKQLKQKASIFKMADVNAGKKTFPNKTLWFKLQLNGRKAGTSQASCLDNRQKNQNNKKHRMTSEDSKRLALLIIH